MKKKERKEEGVETGKDGGRSRKRGKGKRSRKGGKKRRGKWERGEMKEGLRRVKESWSGGERGGKRGGRGGKRGE